MKAGFFYDAKQDYFNGKFYGGAINASLWQRYLAYFDSIVVCARFVKVADSNGILSSCKNVEFDCIECTGNIAKDYLALKELSVKQHIKKCLDYVDFAIIRLPSEIGLIAAKYCRKFNKPYLIELVGCPWDTNWHHGLLGKLLAPNMTLRTKYAVKNARHVIYVSNNFLQSRYPTNGNAYACSDVICNYTKASIDERINKINSIDKFINIGTAGAVDVVNKGQEFVIAALSRLKEKGYTNYKYKLAGGGSTEYLTSKAIEYGVENQLEFLGGLNREQMQNFYQDIDIYIQSSNTEGLCRSILEAKSFACPVIASNVGGNVEIVNSDFLYDNNSNRVDNIVDKILLMTNKEIMLKEAKQNHADSKYYDFDVLNNKRDEVYRQILRDTNND